MNLEHLRGKWVIVNTRDGRRYAGRLDEQADVCIPGTLVLTVAVELFMMPVPGKPGSFTEVPARQKGGIFPLYVVATGLLEIEYSNGRSMLLNAGVEYKPEQKEEPS